MINLTKAFAEDSRNNDKENKSLLNFMMSEQQNFDAAIKRFNLFEIQDVLINDNVWRFNGAIQNCPEEYRKDDWIFENFAFIEQISCAIIKNVKAVTVQYPTPKCYAFLGQLKNLATLKIKVSSVEEFEKVMSALKLLEYVESLELCIPNGTIQVLDLIHFKVKRITCVMFDFEENPVCKPREDIEYLTFEEHEKPTHNFVFEPQHFVNYSIIFPYTRHFEFSVNHIITDNDIEVYKICERDSDNFAKEIQEKTGDYRSFNIRIEYQNLTPIMKSSMYKALQSITFNPNGIYGYPQSRQFCLPVRLSVSFDFPQKKEYAANKWNRRVIYTKTIPTEYKKLFKPEDFVIVQAVDPYQNIAVFKFPYDLKIAVFKEFYGKHVGVSRHNLRFLFYGRRFSDEDTMKRIIRDYKKNDHQPNIIEVYASQWG